MLPIGDLLQLYVCLAVVIDVRRRYEAAVSHSRQQNHLALPHSTMHRLGLKKWGESGGRMIWRMMKNRLYRTNMRVNLLSQKKN